MGSAQERPVNRQSLVTLAAGSAARAAVGTPVTAPPVPLPLPPAQCPARASRKVEAEALNASRHSRAVASPRPAASTARSAATRSTTCAGRGAEARGPPAHQGHHAGRPRWAGLWAGPGAGRGGVPALLPPAASLFSLWLPRSPPPSSLSCRPPLTVEMDDTR